MKKLPLAVSLIGFFGIFGGFITFLVGEILDKPNRLSLPGLFVFIGTITLLSVLGLISTKSCPVMVREPTRKLVLTPREKAPLRYWLFLFIWTGITVFFYFVAMRMFFGWVPEGFRWGLLTSSPALSVGLSDLGA